MKRLLTGLLLCAALLTACSSAPPDDITGLSKNSVGAYMDGRLYFGAGGMNMRFFLPSIWEERVLCFDPICDHMNSDCSAYSGGFLSTYIAAADGYVYTTVSTAEGSGILQYNAESVRKNMVLKDFPNTIGKFIVCEDFIYFCAVDDDNIQNIYLTDMDGNFRCLTEGMNEVLILMAVENGHVWFFSQSGKIYRADPNFEQIDVVHEIHTGITNGYFYHKGYLYYFDDVTYKTHAAGEREIEADTYNMYRLALPDEGTVSAETASPERIAEGVRPSSDWYFKDDAAWISASEFTVVGTRYFESGGKVIRLDLQKGEAAEEVVIENTDMGAILYADEQYIFGFGAYLDEETQSKKMGFILYDRTNHKVSYIQG